MARVTKTKAPAKKAAVKKAVKPTAKPAPTSVEAAGSPGPALTPADHEAIARMVVDMMQPYTPQKDAHVEGDTAPLDPIEIATEAMEDTKESSRHVTEAEPLETGTLTPEAIALMTEDQIAEYNQKEVAKMRARKKAQAENRKGADEMTIRQRMAAVKKDRDPSVIRIAIDPNYDGDDYVRVICKRRIGLDRGVTSDLEETVDMPRHVAKKMQADGIVAIAI